MKIVSIASSSLGNCYLISDGTSNLLLECGVQLKKVQNVVSDLSVIDGCLITHEHGDHSAYTKEIMKYTTVYASLGTLEALNAKHSIPKHMQVLQKRLTHNESKTIGSFVIVPFTTQHDAAEPLGFLIYSTKTQEKLLFATDSYYIKNRFTGLDYIMVECNYDKNLLSDNLTKNERLRLLQSHFELSNVKKFLNATDLSKCKKIYLMHLSNRHSDAKRFKQEIEAETGVPVEVCE